MFKNGNSKHLIWISLLLSTPTVAYIIYKKLTPEPYSIQEYQKIEPEKPDRVAASEEESLPDTQPASSNKQEKLAQIRQNRHSNETVTVPVDSLREQTMNKLDPSVRDDRFSHLGFEEVLNTKAMRENAGYTFYQTDNLESSLINFDGKKHPVVRKKNHILNSIVTGVILVKFKQYPGDVKTFANEFGLTTKAEMKQIRSVAFTSQKYPVNLLAVVDALNSSEIVETATLEMLTGKRKKQ